MMRNRGLMCAEGKNWPGRHVKSIVFWAME
jgi:hypothetical protein